MILMKCMCEDDECDCILFSIVVRYCIVELYKFKCLNFLSRSEDEGARGKRIIFYCSGGVNEY